MRAPKVPHMGTSAPLSRPPTTPARAQRLLALGKELLHHGPARALYVGREQVNGARKRNGQHEGGGFFCAVGLVLFAKGVEQPGVNEGAGQQEGRQAEQAQQERPDPFAHGAADGPFRGDKPRNHAAQQKDAKQQTA